jgi:hypothetical protein
VIRQRQKSDPFRRHQLRRDDQHAGRARQSQQKASTSLLNLFFYRVEPSRFYADAGSHDPWFIRVLCLVTAFSTTETIDDPETHSTTMIPEGGSTFGCSASAALFQREPIIVPSAPRRMSARISRSAHAAIQPGDQPDLSTQGDVAYRPSLLYEIALLTIEPRTRSSPPLPVVAGGLNLHSRAYVVDGRHAPPSLPAAWISPRMDIGAGDNWVPALSYVTAGVATQSIAVAAAPSLKIPLWIAGRPGATVRLVWQHIDRGVWEPVPGGGSDVIVPAQPNPPGNGVIDPAAAGTAAKLDVAVPVPAALPAYLLLTAERSGTAGGTAQQSADPHGPAMTHPALAAEWKRIECLCDIVQESRQGKEPSPDLVKKLKELQAQVMAARAQGSWDALGTAGLSHLALDIIACAAAPEMSYVAAYAYSALGADPVTQAPSKRMIRALLALEPDDIVALNAELSPDAPLRVRGLIAVERGGTAAVIASGRTLRQALFGDSDSSAPPGTVRVRRKAAWDDLVVSEQCRRMLQEFCAFIRHHETVERDWAGARRGGPVALFSGPSGTGKTLAAIVLATELRFPLYRIDLGQLVSKYIGETEKNLNALFGGRRRQHSAVRRIRRPVRSPRRG